MSDTKQPLPPSEEVTRTTSKCPGREAPLTRIPPIPQDSSCHHNLLNNEKLFIVFMLTLLLNPDPSPSTDRNGSTWTWFTFGRWGSEPPVDALMGVAVLRNVFL